MSFVAAKPLLHHRFPDLAASLPHVRLGSRSPVRPLNGLGEGVWLKDDSLYGDGPWGGNKIRKLEWILPDVKRRGKDTILTFGGLGTNHGLATALYGREQGLKVVLALIDQPRDAHVREQLARLRASGATLHFTHNKARTILAAPWLMAHHRLPYFLSAGGSSPVGTLGYVEAALELAEQVREGLLPEPSHVVVPVGSGGTAAGLALGLVLAGLRTTVVGVVVNDTLRLDERALTRLARRAGRRLGLRPRSLKLALMRNWLGPGYGHPTEESTWALGVAGEREGLDLEPVYTAKAMAALLTLRERGDFGGGPVLFVNTHGPRA